jgi:hypothetical protein
MWFLQVLAIANNNHLVKTAVMANSPAEAMVSQVVVTDRVLASLQVAMDRVAALLLVAMVNQDQVAATASSLEDMVDLEERQEDTEGPEAAVVVTAAQAEVAAAAMVVAAAAMVVAAAAAMTTEVGCLQYCCAYD